MKVTFYGVRGSFPCSWPQNRRYGGNTSAVAVEVDGEPPLLLDLGSGLPGLRAGPPREKGFRANALVTHLHLDHIQGLPYFPAVHRPDTRLDIYGPPQEHGSLLDGIANLVRPPYFPVRLADFASELHFHEVADADLDLGTAKVRVRPVPHRGPTVGYRIEWGGGTLAYVSDHQAPPTLDHVAEPVLELCDGVDLLVHEAQYTGAQFAEKQLWGHGTVDYAVLVAKKAGARRLCLFHHDPWQSDDQLDSMLEDARLASAGTCIEEVLSASEGLVLTI